MAFLVQSMKEGMFLPKPTLTEENLPDQKGRVHIVTGGYSGVGLELCKILYSRNATVYVAGRSKEKADNAIETIKKANEKSTGKVEFLKVDLSDFKTIKPAVEEFLSKESRLDVLTNNAGVMFPPRGSKDAQGNELQIGTNCLGPYLFSTLLVPILQKTAKDAPKDSVRVTWASSIGVALFAPPNGVKFDDKGEVQQSLSTTHMEYGQAKTGNNFLAIEFARHYGKDGIISVSWNPGNLSSGLQRHMPKVQAVLLNTILHPPVMGAYTELYAACSPDITASNNGCYIAPWGRISKTRADVETSMKTTEEGGNGISAKFWDWCDKKTSEFK